MSNRVVLSPGYYPLPDIGRPVSSGKIYVGYPDLDPVIDEGNQKQIKILQEDGNLIEVAQPIRTSKGGVPTYNGSPVTIFVEGPYSLSVLDKHDSQIYYVPLSADGTNKLITIETIGDLRDVVGSFQNQSADVLGYDTPGDGGGGKYIWFEGFPVGFYSDDDGYVIVPNGGDESAAWLKSSVTTIKAATFGATGDMDGSTDFGEELQNTINYANSVRNESNQAFVIIELETGKVFKFATGLVVPTRIQIRVNGSRLWYTGTGTAVQLGDNSSSLSQFNALTDFYMWLEDKTSKGVRLLATTGAYVQGYVEGLYAPFDNTRTNIGVELDGANASSFNNTISVLANHVHECFRQWTSGTTPATSNLYINCSAVADQTTDDSGICWNFADGSTNDGTKLIECNIEQGNTGIYFGDGSEAIDVNARWEISQLSGARTVKFHANTKAITLKGAGIDSALIGDVNGGIEGFANGAHRIIDRNGNTRSGGNDSSFAGISTPVRAFGEKNILFRSNERTFFQTTDDSTGTGEFLFQPGQGSSNTGAFLHLYAHSATEPGDCRIGPSSGAGTFAVQIGRGGPIGLNVAQDEVLPGVDNTSRLGKTGFRWSEINSVLINGVSLQLTGLSVYADEAAAIAGGLQSDFVYKTLTGELRIKL